VSADDLDLAVVVLSYGPRRTLTDAVHSLLAQESRAEIVIVHSGGGQPPEALMAANAAVRLIVVSTRLYPGAARNVGVASTKAPYVAFLADDCMADTGWIDHRITRHRAGARAVASALVCHKPYAPVALAAHLSLYCRRMPRANPSFALRYGVSYDRGLFATYGLFREDLESGEDTEFNQRLSPADAPHWAPEIITVHQGAESISAFFRSQWSRGKRMARAWRALGAFGASEVGRNALARTGMILREMWDVIEPRQRVTAALSAPLIVLGNISYACGALMSGARR
jgi:glycosyltransferase involved in cell wall biosynthesis